MSAKKERRITLRDTLQKYEGIRVKASSAQSSTVSFSRAVALRHRVVVNDRLPKLTNDPKCIGCSVNQLVVLCNMGKLREVHLGETWQALGEIYSKLRELTERETH